MWRTMFMAFGVFVFLLGSQSLVVQKFVLKSRAAVVETDWTGKSETVPGPQRAIVPTEWAPWSLMGSGAVVWLYAIAISNRMKK